MSSDIHLRASSQEIPQPSITEIICKIKYLKFYSNLPGANELKDRESKRIMILNDLVLLQTSGDKLSYYQ